MRNPSNLIDEFPGEDVFFEFQATDISQPEALKQYAAHAVKEIKSTYGHDTEVHITVEPEAKDKHLFAVSMTVFGLSEPIAIKKTGKQVLAVLRKVRKLAMRKIHRLNEKRATRRRDRTVRDRNRTLDMAI